MVTGPGVAEVVDAPVPEAGPNDVLVKMRACGICGSDAFYIAIGGIPPRQGHTPLGHEPAGEIVAVGADVTDLAVGDHVVINPMAAPGGIIGNGGASGALANYLLIETALAAAKTGATIGIVAVHKEPVPVDFATVMSSEITIVGSMGYPDEIFEVTEDLVANWEKYALIVSHTIPFADVDRALALASTPGAADKVVVTFPE
ncbi:hypothetical protein BH09ACT8_BH09ACT8_16990 [soil metagenome]